MKLREMTRIGDAFCFGNIHVHPCPFRDLSDPPLMGVESGGGGVGGRWRVDVCVSIRIVGASAYAYHYINFSP